VTRPEVERLRKHPELVSLLGLAGQLDLLPVALAAVHEVEHRGALAEQARSMSRVSQILADQVRAYIGMIEEEIVDKRRCR
jgi:hypothetical protein